MTACDVIGIANVRRNSGPAGSTAKKVALKQQSRGVRNTELYEKLKKPMEELARKTPTVHPAFHLRGGDHIGPLHSFKWTVAEGRVKMAAGDQAETVTATVAMLTGVRKEWDLHNITNITIHLVLQH
ncbi:Hypp6241 [Branchiostoma lanceolatum]|uniref:Hypp6241 protein n=1 Tax=Branchiostoma lanceolatum TaxID=7740 RepID=A0A8J9W6H7_BRALA|nr:Hypp6241 [Branchiostoma lanceolatum]